MYRGSSLVLLLFLLTFITEVSQQLVLTYMKNVTPEIAKTSSQLFQFLPLDALEKANIHTENYKLKDKCENYKGWSYSKEV